jgi:hypothetical protein
MIRTRHQSFSVAALHVAGGLAIYACSSNSTTSLAAPVLDSGAVSDTAVGTSGGSSSGGEAGSPGVDASSSGGNTDATTASDAPVEAGAPPSCSSLPGTVVYIESGDTQEPLLKTLGRELRNNANITIVYELTGSCTLTPNVENATLIPANTNMLYIPSTAENPSWTTADAELTCTTSSTGGTAPDLGIAALFPSSCSGVTWPPPTGIGAFVGPIQAYTFIVPTAEFSTQKAISAEEAYYAFGDGANNPVLFNASHEWNMPTEFFLRPATKSTLVATALNIGLTAKEMTLVAVDGGTADGRNLEATSGNVLTAVTSATSNEAIGILGDEIYDANRGKGVNVLAFSAFGQNEAYYPDSTTTSFDKQNIRDGHYTLWSPTVYIAPVGATAAPTNPAVAYIVDLVTGTQGATPPGGLSDGGQAIDGLGSIVSVGLTPNCAMQVQRKADGAPLSPYTPPAPCTCYFLSKVPNAGTLPTSCAQCSTSTPCATGSCFNGYCEVPPTPATTGVTGCDVNEEGGYSSIINACTDATAIEKTVITYPGDGGLQPLNP